jgi:hypothetical protein
MPRFLDFLASYAEPTGNQLDANEAAAINEHIDDEGGSWTEIESWYIHNVAVGVFADGNRHVVLHRIDRPIPGARERYEEQMAAYRATLEKIGYEPREPKPWELDTELEQLTGFSGYADEAAAVQDGLRLTLGAVIANQDDVVREWCGWRNDVVILTQSQWDGGPSSEILWVHSTSGLITSNSEEDILRAYSSYAETVQKLIDELESRLEAFDGIANPYFGRRMVQAWLARSAANATLERARHVLRTAADGAAQVTKESEKSGLIKSLAAGLHTDRPNLYRVIPQLKRAAAPNDMQKS